VDAVTHDKIADKSKSFFSKNGIGGTCIQILNSIDRFISISNVRISKWPRRGNLEINTNLAISFLHSFPTIRN